MNIRFLGTRGNIRTRSRRHRWHSALLASHAGGRVMIDCGEDWRRRVAALAPDSIVLTHAHPDHALGLRAGAPCPVYASAETWQALRRYPIEDRRIVPPSSPLSIAGVSFEAFPVVHSLRAPAVGYRIEAGGPALFYVPDVAAIPERARALAGIDLFIGDGATVTRAILRHHGGARFGHAPIRTQLDWCREAGVRCALFTHCGSAIVGGDERRLGPAIRAMARERGVEARIAYDGLEIALP